METQLLIDFKNASASEANQLALDLKSYLDRQSLGDTRVIKTRDDTMDFGGTLSVLLGTSSIVSIAQGISHWLMKHQDRKLTIKTAAGEIIGENLSSRDVEAILKTLNQK